MQGQAEPAPVVHDAFFCSCTAAVEILTGLGIIALGALFFTLSWLTINGAVVLCVALLLSLVLLSWTRFDKGRHPCFLFLCTLTLLQGGRLLTYCLGYLPHPMRAGGFSEYGFDLSTDEIGIVLLCLALSAMCIYAPCRWKYRGLVPPASSTVSRYLPYLYLIFAFIVPVQAYKSYCYYQYIQTHGGYVYFFLNHAGVASSVPLFARAVSLLTLPVFVALFVLETRRKLAYATTVVYFASNVFTLLLGTRGALFALVLALWYVAGLKSTKRRRISALVFVVIGLILFGDVIQTFRETSNGLHQYTFAPIKFVMLQGSSIEVTETAVKYRGIFAPYALHYLLHELQNAFVASDVTNYFRGKSLAFDIPVLLDRNSFNLGHGTGGSYLAEAYVIGGIAGVVVISALIGFGLHYLYRLSRNLLSLIVVALILPDVLIMPRGNLLDWLSVALKYTILIVILYIGWLLFEFIVWLKNGPKARIYGVR